MRAATGRAAARDSIPLRWAGRASLGLPDEASGRNAFGQPHIATDRRAAPDGDAAEDRRTGIDDDVVLDDRVAWVALAQFAAVADLKAPRSKGHRLVEAHVAADDRRLADDDACAVIDEESLADLSARVDVDAGLGMGDLGDDPRQKRRPEPVEFMRQTVAHHRRDARKAKDDLVDAVRRRIELESRAHVLVGPGAYFRQNGEKRARDLVRRPTACARFATRMLLLKREREADLAPEGPQGFREHARHEGVSVARVQSWRAEVTRIERGHEAFDYGADRLARRQARRATAIAAQLGSGAQSPELSHDARDSGVVDRLIVAHGRRRERHGIGNRPTARRTSSSLQPMEL